VRRQLSNALLPSILKEDTVIGSAAVFFVEEHEQWHDNLNEFFLLSLLCVPVELRKILRLV